MTDDSQHYDTPQPDEGLDALWSFLEDDSIRIPVPIPSKTHPEGKLYTVPSPDAETGIRLTALADIARKQQSGVHVSERDVARLQMDDDEEREFAQQVMGKCYTEMVEDGVAWVTIQKVMQYSYIYFSMGREVAEKAAREGLFQGGKVRLPAMNRADRRAATRAEMRTRATHGTL